MKQKNTVKLVMRLNTTLAGGGGEQFADQGTALFSFSPTKRKPCVIHEHVVM